MTPKVTPGRRFRQAMDEALQHASAERGAPLYWDVQELELIERGAAAADRREKVERRVNALLDNPDADVREITALSNEVRQLDRLIQTFMSRLMKGLEPPKNAMQLRKSRAADHRWNKERRAAAEGGD